MTRSDSVRNRRSILDAAQRLTAVGGTEVSVQDVAAAAGVAVGTVYRHWPSKHELFRSVLLRRLDDVASQAEEAVSLESFFDAVTQLCVSDRPLLQLLDGQGSDSPADDDATRDRLDSAVAVLIDSARRSGRLRHDLAPQDLRIYLIGLRAALASHDSQAWRRHYSIYRTGLFRSAAADPQSR